MRLGESGIIKHLGENSFNTKKDQCVIRNAEEQRQNGPLTLFAMISAFIILGFGVGISLLVFGLEFVVFWSAGNRLISRKSVQPQLRKISVGMEIENIENLNAAEL